MKYLLLLVFFLCISKLHAQQTGNLRYDLIGVWQLNSSTIDTTNCIKQKSQITLFKNFEFEINYNTTNEDVNVIKERGKWSIDTNLRRINFYDITITMATNEVAEKDYFITIKNFSQDTLITDKCFCYIGEELTSKSNSRCSAIYKRVK